MNEYRLFKNVIIQSNVCRKLEANRSSVLDLQNK